ncbi:hypothetical protein [Neorhizobium tomejilense]|uniref:hypothetical protein n=1 Tax=Neorhizobium tomejilense TaxID=2093828 RepID=UPI003CCA642D
MAILKQNPIAYRGVVTALVEDIEIALVVFLLRKISRLHEKTFRVGKGWSGDLIVISISSQDDSEIEDIRRFRMLAENSFDLEVAILVKKFFQTQYRPFHRFALVLHLSMLLLLVHGANGRRCRSIAR